MDDISNSILFPATYITKQHQIYKWMVGVYIEHPQSHLLGGPVLPRIQKIKLQSTPEDPQQEMDGQKYRTHNQSSVIMHNLSSDENLQR